MIFHIKIDKLRLNVDKTDKILCWPWSTFVLMFILPFCHAQIIISVRLYCKYGNVVKALFSARPYEPSVMIGGTSGDRAWDATDMVDTW